MAGKYQEYPEYISSGVAWLGQVPAHWEPIRFKHRLSEKKKTSNPELEAGSISFGRVIYKSSENLAPETKASYQEVLAEEFLINPLNMNYDLLSLRTALSEIDVVVSTGYIVVRSDDRLVKRYVRWLLQEFDVAHMKTLGSGVRQTINYMDIGNSFFYEPTRVEQEKIANFLDHETAKIDTLIEKQQQLIKLLKEKRQAVISHAVTKGLNPNAPMRDSGVEWLGEVPEHWVSCALKNYARVVDCKHITAEFFDEGIPLASISEVKEWHVNLATAKLTNEKYYLDLIGGGRKPETGDIIYSRNATVGEAALVTENMPKFAMGQDVCLIRLDEAVSSEYLLYVLKSGVISNQLDLAMVGSTFKRINVDDIRNFAIALPSYDEQVAIVAELTRILGKYDSLVANAEKTIGLMTERRTALISAAVTGKIDVRNWQAPEPTDNKNKEVAA